MLFLLAAGCALAIAGIFLSLWVGARPRRYSRAEVASMRGSLRIIHIKLSDDEVEKRLSTEIQQETCPVQLAQLAELNVKKRQEHAGERAL
jgi:hypothetical protein